MSEKPLSCRVKTVFLGVADLQWGWVTAQTHGKEGALWSEGRVFQVRHSWGEHGAPCPHPCLEATCGLFQPHPACALSQ